jgi:hypothetical protein
MSITAQQLADLMPDATQLVLSPEEAATQAETRAERLVEQMRSLGIEPEL